MPDHPDALHFLGLLTGQLGKIDQAAHLMEQAIQALPNNAIYHHNFGSFLKDRG